jgi:hypothetical protein
MDVQAGKQACERTTIGQEFLVTRAKSGLNSVGNGSSIEVDFRKRAFIPLRIDAPIVNLNIHFLDR